MPSELRRVSVTNPPKVRLLMNLGRVGAAAIAAFVTYFILGGAFFANPAMRAEFARFGAVYRTQQSMKSVMPLGMLGMLLSMVALSALFAMIHPGGAGVVAGVQFGVLIALYAVGSFVLHNYVNLNIGGRLTAFQTVAYCVEWLVVGIVISLVYRA
jgi:hypothetical protein